MKGVTVLIILLVMLPVIYSESFSRPYTFGATSNRAALQNMTVYSEYGGGPVYISNEPVDVNRFYKSRHVPLAYSQGLQDRAEITPSLTPLQRYRQNVRALQALGYSLADIPPHERAQYVKNINEEMPFLQKADRQKRIAFMRGATVIENRIISDSYWARAKRKGEYKFHGLTGIAR